MLDVNNPNCWNIPDSLSHCVHMCFRAINTQPPPEILRDYEGRHHPEIFNELLLLFPVSDL